MVYNRDRLSPPKGRRSRSSPPYPQRSGPHFAHPPRYTARKITSGKRHFVAGIWANAGLPTIVVNWLQQLLQCPPLDFLGHQAGMSKAPLIGSFCALRSDFPCPASRGERPRVDGSLILGRGRLSPACTGAYSVPGGRDVSGVCSTSLMRLSLALSVRGYLITSVGGGGPNKERAL